MNGTSSAIAGIFADRYEIVRTLGYGGTAFVYAARDVTSGSMVAVKVLRDELLDGVAADRFLREIRLNQKLSHPAIVPVIDSGQDGRRLFLVLPFMEQGTLRDLLSRETQLPLDRVIRITKTIAEALEYAHEQGLIHRDVKPENILFTNGEARLGDFGIARALERSIDETTTTTGIARGTPPYMSPEQIGGGQYDGRTDVYSLACVTYEMLAGMLPYIGPTPHSVISQKMLHPPRPIRVYRPLLPEAVEAVISHALAIDPADRLQSASEFASQLERSITAPAVPSRTPRSVARPKTWMIGVATVAAIASALFVNSRLQGGGSRAQLDPNRVMIFPLALVAGAPSANAGAVGEDAATMIGSAIDGAGPLHSLDAWPLLPAAVRDTIRLLVPIEAARLARASGSGRYVTGRVLTSADSTHVLLDLWDTKNDSVIARARVASAASTNGLWHLTLRAVGDILPQLIPGNAANALSGWRDRNPVAIASFLLGEEAYRRGNFTAAVSHYRSALRTDSTFTLAAIRGAQSSSWLTRPDDATDFIRIAQRSPSAPRYASFVRGYSAYLRGDADSAIAAFRAAIAEDAGMAVAWIQLGESYIHLTPRFGNADSLARDAFDHALALDSSAAAVLFHPIQIALRQGDIGRADRMLARFSASDPDSTLRQVGIMRGCVTGERVDWREHARSHPRALVSSAVALAAGGAQVGCAATAFEALLAADTSASDPDAEGRRWASLVGLVNARLVQGRAKDAAAAIDAFDRRWKYGTSLFLFTAPFDTLMARRGREVMLADSARFGPNFTKSPFTFRLWELAQFKLLEGDVTVAEAAARELEVRADTSRDPMDKVLSRSIRARIALARKDTARAIVLLDSVVPPTAPAPVALWHEMGAAPGERLLRAQIARARGDNQLAMLLAEPIDSPSASMHLLFLPASLELRIGAARAMGDQAAASKLTQRLERLRR